MKELYDLLCAASEEQRQNLAALTNSAFGSAPATLCNHIRFLRTGSIGQLFWDISWKQIVTDVADEIAIDWNKTLNGRTWSDLDTESIENAVVAKLFQDMLTQLKPEQRQALIMELKRDTNDAHLENYLLGGGIRLAANMSGFGIYLLASTILGSLTSALGITLPFAIYMGMSQSLALILGPVGWLALVGGILFSLNQPNWNRLQLTVVYVAILRHSPEAEIMAVT